MGVKRKTKWSKPLYWEDSKFNGNEQPVVGISWYEALAFCAWLSEKSLENINLTTEQQWQRAAQGDDSRAFPWGNDWDTAYCNNNVDGKSISRRTTPVTQYEKLGASPFGVVDMVGNVKEWCLDSYENSEPNVHEVVSRGAAWDTQGSFDTYQINSRFNRFRNHPYERNPYIGFRITRSL